MISFSQAAFKILSLLLSVNSMIMVGLSVDLFEFILFGFLWASWIFNLFFFFNLICGIFSCYFFSDAFIPILSVLYFWDSHYVYVGMQDGIPQLSEVLFIFLNYFFLFFRLENLYWPLFKWAVFVLCQLKSDVELF